MTQPIARPSDPITSHLAAAELTNRTPLIELITDYVATHPGQTRGEIADGLGLDQPRVWRRVSDAVNRGHIFYGDPKIYAGRQQQTCWPYPVKA